MIQAKREKLGLPPHFAYTRNLTRLSVCLISLLGDVMAIQFPLDLRFKLIALAPRIIVTDAAGQNVCFVSQKVLKLKEDIQVFADESRSRELYRIKADRIIDFSATYNFSESASGKPLGAIRSKGWRSIWKATYEIVDSSGNLTYRIVEDNPWVKVLDALLNEVPVIGIFTGYMFHPKYSAYDVNTNQPVMSLEKQPAFFEGKFKLEKLDPSLSPEVEQRLMLSFMLMVQFMRRRG